jgi:hypothetical protein
MAGDSLRDAISDVRGAVSDIVEVESTNDPLVFIDNDVTGNEASLLFRQKFAVPLREFFKEFIASVANGLRKVRAVRQFELEDCRLVVGAKPL